MVEDIGGGLEAHDVGLTFGGLRALDQVDLEVPAGTVHALIGPNGAGKTTLLNVLSGIYQPQQGRVTYRGGTLTGVPTYQVAKLGVGRTYQHPSLFAGMTVEENILVGRHLGTRAGLWRCGLRTPGARREEAVARSQVRDVAERLDLIGVLAESAAVQTHGVQKRVDLARALAMRPSMILMDEPASGMQSADRRQLVELIRRLVDEDHITVVLVDHDMDLVERVSDHITVLHHGRVIETGTMNVVVKSPVVIDAYLGSNAVESSRTDEVLGTSTPGLRKEEEG